MQPQLKGEETAPPADPGAPYDETYYNCGFGTIPYDRNDYWLGFFAGIAEQLARSLNPRKVLDAGCALGFLVESFWARGIEAWGIDVSAYAISRVRRDIAPYCRQASLTDPIPGAYDLVTCIEVLEHIPPEDTAQVIRNLTSVTDTILFSSTPSDFDEPTHVNVRPPLYWLKAFAECGFQPDMLFDVGFLTPHGFLLRRGPALPEESLTLFSRLILYRCVLAGKDNSYQSLLRQQTDIQRQIETLTARNRDLEGVNSQMLMLRQQSDSLLSAIRVVEGEREALRAEVRQVAPRLAELADAKQQLQLLAETSEQNRALSQQLAELRDQHTASTQRIAELREQNAASTEQVLQLTRDRNALDVQLRDVLQSPGWKIIQHYRQWLDRNIQSRPWLRKTYEPVVWWFLRRFSGQRSRDARTAVQPDTSVSSNPASRSNEVADPIPQPAPAPAPPVRQPITYDQWIAAAEPNTADLEAQRKRARDLPYRPVISVVLPVYRISLPILQACVRSVLHQTYDQWELCIAHAAPEAIDHRSFLTEFAALDRRVKLVLLDQNEGISANTNHALALATGEFVALLDHDDTLAPFALYEVANLLGVNPALDLIYSDHDYIDDSNARRFNPLFKPDWSPDIMLSANYITHLTVLRRSLVNEIGGFDPSTDGAQDWDLFFKLTERTTRIAHIPQVLYHWRTHSSSTALNTAAKDYAQTAQLRAIQAHLDRLAIPAQAEVKSNGLLHLRWALANRKRVSIIIPSKDKVDLLSRCIRTLHAVTAYDNLEILVVDNGSTEPATHRYYDTLRNLPGVRVLDWPHPFNYSAMNNFGARNATGDLLLFLNNDIEITTPEWLDELAGWMEIPSVGIVGARLLRPDHTIQHAGVVVGFDGFAGHPFADQPALTFNVYGSTGWYRDYLAVTGACLMIRRDTFNEIGGFDEEFITCGSDVEICLRASQHGYRTVYNPFAELVHYECQTRKGDVPTNDFFVSFKHYQPYLLNGDPYWNPNLSLWDKNIGFRAADEPSPLTFVQDYLRNLQRSPASPQPASPKPAPLPESKEEDLFVTWFDHTSEDLRASRQLMASVQGFRPVRKMIWFIPPFEHAFYGGIFTILRFADGWARTEGVTNHFAICGSASREQMAERIRNIHPGCTAASVTILSSPGDVADLPEADACVATLWTTAYYALKFRKAPRKFYFIQDYEPGFYRAGSASALVDNTYRFGFYGIANTVSLKDVYEREYGAKAAYFSPCVDLSVFHPASTPLANSQKWRLFCYARPQHARNAFELLAAALRIVKSHLGRNVQILCAGSQWEPRDHGLENIVENLGLLTYQQTAEFYRTCHAGAVLMLTRHPSYIPLELMASGCLVITNRSHWTEWLLRNEENCLLSNTTATCLAETIERGLADHDLRQRITTAASALVTEQYSNWEQEIVRTYPFLCNPEQV